MVHFNLQIDLVCWFICVLLCCHINLNRKDWNKSIIFVNKKWRLFGPRMLSAVTVSRQRIGNVPVLWSFRLWSYVLEHIGADISHWRESWGTERCDLQNTGCWLLMTFKHQGKLKVCVRRLWNWGLQYNFVIFLWKQNYLERQQKTN